MNRRDALKTLVALPSVAAIQTANVGPNDVIVIECVHPLAQRQFEHIRQLLQDVWPDRKCLILDDSLHLKIVRGD